jgi:hypothetical protein
MKQFISILSFITLLFLILGCSKDNMVEPVLPQADEQSSSLTKSNSDTKSLAESKPDAKCFTKSKFVKKFTFTGTETLDAISDPSRVLDPGTVVVKGDKIIIKGYTVLADISMQIEGMGEKKGTDKVMMNAVIDTLTFSGHLEGTNVFEIEGKPAWKGVWKGKRTMIGDGKWLADLKFRGIGVEDHEGSTIRGSLKAYSEMPIPLKYSGPMKGLIKFLN